MENTKKKRLKRIITGISIITMYTTSVFGSIDLTETENEFGLMANQETNITESATNTPANEITAPNEITEAEEINNEIADNEITMPSETQTIQPDAQAAGDAQTAETEIDLTGNEEEEEIHVKLTAAGTENGIDRIRTGWKNTEQGKQYILDSGPATGLIQIKDQWFAFNDEGYAESGWFVRDGQNMYAFLDGLIATGLVEIGDDLYLFDELGYAITGWTVFENDIYYTDASGKVTKGWFETDGKKYLAMDDGKILYGWIIYGDNSYYQTENGVLTGMQNIDGETIIFGESGALANGVVTLNGNLYITDEGYTKSGWIETTKGRVYADNKGKLLLGWQEIDGKKYYFNKNGYAATGIVSIDKETYLFDPDGVLINRLLVESAMPIIGDMSSSLTYTDTLYEGEYPDPTKLVVTQEGLLFHDSREISGTTKDPVWTAPAYGDVVLPVETANGTESITVHAIPIDHVEAVYTAPLYKDEKPLIQNIKVTAVYEDGRRKPIKSFTCDLPKKADNTTVKVVSEYGNADLKLEIMKETGLHASYSGAVKEGDTPKREYFQVWTLVDGKRQYIEEFDYDEKPVTEDTFIKIKANGDETSCRIKCNEIESVHVFGTVYKDETLNGKNLSVRYADGSSKRITASEYEWESMMETADGTVKHISYQGNRYPVEMEVDESLSNIVTNNTYATGAVNNSSVQTAQEQYTTRTSLGIWTLTAYADTPEDQGPYVGQTASGAPLVEGRTVAVSSATMERLGLVFGDKLEINGHVYVIEDHGGSAMHDKNWVDIFVTDPAREYDAAYNTPSEVFLLR